MKLVQRILRPVFAIRMVASIWLVFFAIWLASNGAKYNLLPHSAMGLYGPWFCWGMILVLLWFPEAMSEYFGWEERGGTCFLIGCGLTVLTVFFALLG